MKAFLNYVSGKKPEEEIVLENLNALVNLLDDVGSCIISTNGCLHIRVYDDYVE